MTFIQNKYYKVYFSLTDRAKSRTLPKETYIEKHHVIPKSLGGSNSKDNIVLLTAREHFICHWLLTKMTEGKEKRKMCYALNLMKTHHTNKRYMTPITSRVFENVRSELIVSDETRKKMSAALKGKKKPAGFGEKISNALKGRPGANKGKCLTAEEKLQRSISNLGKNKGKIPWNKGKSHPCAAQTAAKIAQANTGKVFSKEHKLKLSLSTKGIPKPRFDCDLCGKSIGGLGNYKRHLTLCK